MPSTSRARVAARFRVSRDPPRRRRLRASARARAETDRRATPPAGSSRTPDADSRFRRRRVDRRSSGSRRTPPDLGWRRCSDRCPALAGPAASTTRPALTQERRPAGVEHRWRDVREAHLWSSRACRQTRAQAAGSRAAREAPRRRETRHACPRRGRQAPRRDPRQRRRSCRRRRPGSAGRQRDRTAAISPSYGDARKRGFKSAGGSYGSWGSKRWAHRNHGAPAAGAWTPDIHLTARATTSSARRSTVP